MNVLVTGGSGFLGGRVIPLLVGEGHHVSALARSVAAERRVCELGATAVVGDLDDPASVDAAFAANGAEALVNLASMGFGHAPTIVAAAEEAGLHRAVFVSTTAVSTRLPARSRAVRLEAENAVKASALEWTIVRPTMIYGLPGDRNMARLLGFVRRAPVIPLPGGGRGLQQPVHVDDLAQAIVACLSRPVSIGQIYELAGPEPLDLHGVVAAAADAVGRRPRLVPIPLAAVATLARLHEATARRPRLKAEQVLRLAENKVFDVGPARRDLGFAPRPFDEGIHAEAALVL